MFDVGIIGAGPAGYTLAIRLAQKGKKVALFERYFVGGTCLNLGCIPTKAILHSCNLYNNMKKADKYGISADNISFDYGKIQERKNSVVMKMRTALEKLILANGVEIIKGVAKIKDKNNIECNDTIYNCEKIVVATGSEPFELPQLKGNKIVLNSNFILNIQELPKSILIVGSGAIGLEWARILSTLGVEVHLAEMAEKLLPVADFEVSDRIVRLLKKNKVKIYTNNALEKVEDGKVYLKNGEVLEPEKVLIAIGRKILLPQSEIEFELDERKRPILDENFENKNGIFVIGDAGSKIQLAHNAIMQALLLADYFCDGKQPNDFLVPSVIYGEPEIAWVGKTEQELENQNYKKTMFPVSALGKAQTDGVIDGFVKVLSVDNKVVGAHIISPEASSLICEFIYPIQNGVSVDELEKICHPHPTYSEANFEAILGINQSHINIIKGA